MLNWSAEPDYRAQQAAELARQFSICREEKAREDAAANESQRWSALLAANDAGVDHAAAENEVEGDDAVDAGAVAVVPPAGSTDVRDWFVGWLTHPGDAAVRAAVAVAADDAALVGRLRDGVALLHLLRAVSPAGYGALPRNIGRVGVFHARDRVSVFRAAMLGRVGLGAAAVFDDGDLCDGGNDALVLSCLRALARRHPAPPAAVPAADAVASAVAETPGGTLPVRAHRDGDAAENRESICSACAVM
jgi:hypothetical protein